MPSTCVKCGEQEHCVCLRRTEPFPTELVLRSMQRAKDAIERVKTHGYSCESRSGRKHG